MPTTFPAAYLSVTDELQIQWPNAAGVIGLVPELLFQDVESETEVPTGWFARFSMQEVDQEQTTFRNGEDKRYTSIGLVFLQLYAPAEDITAAQKLRDLGQFAKTIFRPKMQDGCIKFSNIRVNRLEPEHGRRRANLVAEYEFDEIG